MATMTVAGTSRTSADVRLESAKWAKADIDTIEGNYSFLVLVKPGKPSAVA